MGRDMVGDRRDARREVGDLLGLDEAEMALRHGEIARRGRAPKTGKPASATPRRQRSAWRGLPTLLRTIPAMATSGRNAAKPLAIAPADWD